MVEADHRMSSNFLEMPKRMALIIVSGEYGELR